MICRMQAYSYPRADEFMQKEIAADQTDKGKKEAMRAEVSKPDLQIKSTYWNKLLTDTQISLDFMRNAMTGFRYDNQVNLLREYDQNFFESAGEIFIKK